MYLFSLWLRLFGFVSSNCLMAASLTDVSAFAGVIGKPTHLATRRTLALVTAMFNGVVAFGSYAMRRGLNS